MMEVVSVHSCIFASFISRLVLLAIDILSVLVLLGIDMLSVLSGRRSVRRLRHVRVTWKRGTGGQENGCYAWLIRKMYAKELLD
jgi:hypothetical protein